MAQRAQLDDVNNPLHEASRIERAQQKWPRKFEQFFKWKLWA
jgi:hypothetical protein